MATGTQQANEQSRSLARQSSRVPMGWGGELFNLSPFTLLNVMTEQMDRLFSGVPDREGRGTGISQWIPTVEMREKDGNLVVSADLPGLEKSDVKVEAYEDMLTIEGERRQEHQQQEGGFHHTERRYGRFYRSIRLPDGAKADQARAEFRNGVLEVTIPLPPETRQQRKQIAITEKK